AAPVLIRRRAASVRAAADRWARALPDLPGPQAERARRPRLRAAQPAERRPRADPHTSAYGATTATGSPGRGRSTAGDDFVGICEAKLGGNASRAKRRAKEDPMPPRWPVASPTLAGLTLTAGMPIRAADTGLLDQARKMFAPLGQEPLAGSQRATAPQIFLGRTLYFDPRVSADGTVSCARCHQPSLYGT